MNILESQCIIKMINNSHYVFQFIWSVCVIFKISVFFFKILTEVDLEGARGPGSPFSEKNLFWLYRKSQCVILIHQYVKKITVCNLFLKKRFNLNIVLTRITSHSFLYSCLHRTARFYSRKYIMYAYSHYLLLSIDHSDKTPMKIFS